ncbi:hypothetical protein H2200_003461 [Cladophialophora chaetospira]|uniref:Uncharacterized protein n=1 Tax=Cladophialophora chaetospira TaxID=386627 RepID=A0AA39CLF7_9EURO|nr:hypothetical protein H2200_003461 [Cladophialophora chaetospira]
MATQSPIAMVTEVTQHEEVLNLLLPPGRSKSDTTSLSASTTPKCTDESASSSLRTADFPLPVSPTGNRISTDSSTSEPPKDTSTGSVGTVEGANESTFDHGAETSTCSTGPVAPPSNKFAGTALREKAINTDYR